MSALELLQEIILYYASSRGAGHSRLLWEGTRAHPEALVVVANAHQARHVPHRRERVVTLHQLQSDALAGVRAPLAIDHFALTTLLTDALSEIEGVRVRAERAEAKLRQLDLLLASVDVPQALDGELRDVLERAALFVERSDRLAQAERDRDALSNFAVQQKDIIRARDVAVEDAGIRIDRLERALEEARTRISELDANYEGGSGV